MAKLKTLATCKPTEFLQQTNRIRKKAAAWLTMTDIMNIRKNVPELDEIDESMSDATKVAVAAKNREKLGAQARKNAMKILDAVMDDHPAETLELLALMCFVEPEHVDDFPMADYLAAFTELIESEEVIGFFTSLARLGSRNTQRL